MMKRTFRTLALGTGLLMAATCVVAASAADQQALFSKVEILSDRSLLSIDSDTTDRGQIENPGTLHRLVALPPDATRAQALVIDGEGTASARIVGYMRGLPLALVEMTRPSPGELRVELSHDGNWANDRTNAVRQHSRAMDAVMAGSLPRSGASLGGSYVILTVDTYLEAIEPLVEWKRMKGFDVQVITTALTGGTKEQIQAWLRQAYANWDIPPEYLLIVGDVADIPTWDFSGNPTDHPYTLMDDGDWLPDLILGRLSVENDYEARTVINKTVNYERNPDDGANSDWYRRYLGVAGNYGSVTPINTVKFCGTQLQGIGFQNSFSMGPYDGVYSPPNFGEAQSVPLITTAIDSGVGLVVYRGWAYGVKGWEPPHFITNHIDGLSNGGMTPIVFSFVCLNGDYSVNSGGDVICFGEKWTRAGTPSEPKGAVAFIGNGEHWSHTRYNDAMAISFFERITDPAITTLGGLSVAGRLRFMDYFPHQMDETGDEESVEFYVHIYNLLGDPELNFWKATPTELDVSHEGVFSIGASRTLVGVNEDGGPALAGARVGIVQNDELLGCGFTDEFGQVNVLFSRPVADEGSVTLTVTHPDRRPYQVELNLEDDGAFLALESYEIDDSAGNGDGFASPGESLSLLLTLSNGGTQDALSPSIDMDESDGVTYDDDLAAFPDIAAGESEVALDPVTLTLDSRLEDGRILALGFENIDGTEAGFRFEVSAPVFRVSAVQYGDPGYLAPGTDVEILLTVTNDGRIGAVDLSANLVLDDPTLGTVTDADASWGAIPVGESAVNTANPFRLQLAGDVPHGKALPLTLEFNDNDSYQVDLPLAAVAGLNNPAAPVGPDTHGYYAYDSADFLYEQRPAYEWVELSTSFGGGGTKLDYAYDNQDLPTVALPFAFDYYGQPVTELRIADNGWASFDATPPDYQQPLDFYNWGLPNQHGNHSIVAPFYDNLTTVVADSLAGSEFVDGVYHDYDAGAGIFRVEWSRMRHYRPEINDLQTFQLLIYDPISHPTASGDGEIGFMYRQVNNSDTSRGYATVGIEDQSETDGLQLSYSSIDAPGMAPIGPGLAVKITTEPPSYDPVALDGFTALPSNEGLSLSWTCSDDRPLIGWRLHRVTGDGEILLAELPAARREYLDAGVDPAKDQVYRLEALHPYDLTSDLGSFHSLATGGAVLKLSLGQNLPNPMRENSRINYVLPLAGRLSLKIYDPAGRLVRTLVDGPAEAGAGSLLWDGKDEGGRRAATGVYFYRLNAGGESLTRKLMVVR